LALDIKGDPAGPEGNSPISIPKQKTSLVQKE